MKRVVANNTAKVHLIKSTLTIKYWTKKEIAQITIMVCIILEDIRRINIKLIWDFLYSRLNYNKFILKI